MEAHNLAQVNGKASPVPGLGVIVHFGVPESEEKGRLQFCHIVTATVVVHTLSDILAWKGEILNAECTFAREYMASLISFLDEYPAREQVSTGMN